MEENQDEKRRDSNDNIVLVMEDDKFCPKTMDEGESKEGSSEERLYYSVDSSEPIRTEKHALQYLPNVRDSGSVSGDSDKPLRHRHHGGKRHEKVRRKAKTGTLQEVVAEFSPSESSHSTDQSDSAIHRGKIDKNHINHAPAAGVRGSDERLEKKYLELHQLLKDQFSQQQRILQRQQISMTQRIMKQYKMTGEGFVGEMNARPSSATVPSRSDRLSVKQRPSSASNVRPPRTRGRRRYQSGEPQKETCTQTGPNGGSKSQIIDARNVPALGKKVTFRDPTVWNDPSADDVVIVSCTRSPPRKRPGNRSRTDRSNSFENKGRKGRSLSSDGSDRDTTYSSYTSDSDVSPTRRKNEDHHLRNSDNPKMLQWLKEKNKIYRKQRAKERKEERKKAKEKLIEVEAKQERKKESQKKVQEWMKAKKRQSSKSRERDNSKRKPVNTAESSESEDDENVEYLEGGGKIRVETKKIESRDEGEGKANDEEEQEENIDGEISGIEDDIGASVKQENEKEDVSEKETVKETKRARGRQRLKMAQKVFSPDNIPERPPSAGMNGHIPLRNKLPKLKKRKTKLNKKKTEQKKEQKAPVDEEKQKRFSYDSWIKQKRDQSREQKKKEKVATVKAASEINPDLVNIVSKVAQNRMHSIRGRKKHVDTGLADVDAAANEQYPSSEVKNGVKNDGDEQTENGNINMYRLENEDVNIKPESKKKSKRVRPRSSSTNSKLKTPTPQKSKSLPQKAKLSKSNNEETSGIAPSPPTTTRSYPPRPRVKSAAYKKVKRERKSWEQFADHVWEKLNTDESDSERPPPQGSEDEGIKIKAENLSSLNAIPNDSSLHADPIVVKMPETEFNSQRQVENDINEDKFDSASDTPKTKKEMDEPKDQSDAVKAVISSQSEAPSTFFLTQDSDPKNTDEDENIERKTDRKVSSLDENEAEFRTPRSSADESSEENENQEAKIEDVKVEDDLPGLERRKSVTFADETEVISRTPSSLDSGEAQVVDEAIELEDDIGEVDFNGKSSPPPESSAMNN